MKFLLYLFIFILVSCSSITEQDVSTFTANFKQDVITVRIIASDNPTLECREKFKTPLQQYITYGCASWDWNTKECTVIISKNSTHQILGHEIRHCFEGAFH